MSVDTAAKRASMLSFGDGALLPIPDVAAEVAEDRLHLLWLYGGIAAIEAVVVVELPIGGGKHDHYPPQPFISPRDYKRGWKEHVRAVEDRMWAGRQQVDQTLQKTADKKPVPDKSTKFGDIQPRKIGIPPPAPIERTPPPPKPERKKREPPPQLTDGERMERSRIEAANTRERNDLKAHLRATRQIAEKENKTEEKRQREAEKDIGFKPTQIKRDRTNRAQTYQKREDFAVNLEKGRIEQAKVQAVEEVQRQEMAKRMKKVRAAKKRKAKKGK